MGHTVSDMLNVIITSESCMNINIVNLNKRKIYFQYV